MPPTEPNDAVNPKDNPDLGQEPEPVVSTLPEEDLWERYNKRMEFPLATVATVFLHVVIGALLIYVLIGLMDSGEDRSNTPLQLMQVGGLDDTGEGSAGSGGTDSDLDQKTDPFEPIEVTPPTTIQDPTAKSSDPLPTPKLTLPKTGPKGAGNQPGRGFDGTEGKGPGGIGADSTRARGLRWVLRFRVASGKDYIEQLKSMGAEILIPLPPDNKKRILIGDLRNPSQKVADATDEGRLARKIQFSDNRPQMVREVLEALNVQTPTPPRAFWAFFPKELEEELARKEISYRNRRAEDIEETIFRVTVRGGSYELVVDDQRIKK